MDTEKYNEMQEKLAAGKPVTDEGPYYHHVQWEGYKGWSKGKVGGAAVGTLIGGIVGGAVAIPVLMAVGPAAAGISLLAFAGVGMWKGMDEFSKIITAAATTAAGFDTAERRAEYMLKKTALELKTELGNPDVSAKAAAELKNLKEPAYRTTHYVPTPDSAQEQGPVFWKVAGIGLLVGLAAGLLLAAGGIAAPALEHLLGHQVFEQIGGKVGSTLLSMATFGAFGASFGINRDIFRKIFDTTDMMYRGRVGDQVKAKMVTRSKEPEKSTEKPAPVAYIPTPDYPKSETHFRDAEIAKAQKALKEMDTSCMTPH